MTENSDKTSRIDRRIERINRHIDLAKEFNAVRLHPDPNFEQNSVLIGRLEYKLRLNENLKIKVNTDVKKQEPVPESKKIESQPMDESSETSSDQNLTDEHEG